LKFVHLSRSFQSDQRETEVGADPPEGTRPNGWIKSLDLFGGDIMKLTYRGVSYDYTPPVVEMKTIDEVGKFRGVDIRFRTVKKAPVQQPTLDLVYRGVAYSTGTSAVADATPEVAPATPVAVTAPVAAATVSTDDKARLMMMNRHRSVKQRQQSMLARLAVEAGLPADAAKYWNHIQGKVHPSFWATYSRSGASAS
jgi:hypothetical protein